MLRPGVSLDGCAVEMLVGVAEGPNGLETHLAMQLNVARDHDMVFKVATFCSGTDDMIWALQALNEGLATMYGNGFNLEHVMSVNCDKHSRKFIAKRHTPKFIFGQLSEICCAHRAYDYLSESMVDVPKDINIIIAGIVCREVSPRNCKRKFNQLVILETRGGTGTTFAFLCKFLDRHGKDVQIVTLENVKNICDLQHETRVSNRRVIERDLAQRNFNMFFEKVMNANMHIPQSRPRWWSSWKRSRPIAPGAGPDVGSAEQLVTLR